jgi:hypothetical protein
MLCSLTPQVWRSLHLVGTVVKDDENDKENEENINIQSKDSVRLVMLCMKNYL